MARRMPLPNIGLLSGGGFDEIPMALPGLVRDALEEAGVIEDPQPGLSSRLGEWVALRAWEILVEIPLEGFTDERGFLELWGLCGRGCLLIGEEQVASFEGGNLTVELTRFLAPGVEMLPLRLRFEPALPEGLPPMPAVGIAGGMWLRGVSFLSVQSLRARPDLSARSLSVATRVEAYVRGDYEFTYSLMLGEELLHRQVFAQSLGASTSLLSHTLPVAEPKLWQVGGENELYTLRLSVSKDGLGCDRTQQQVGFRAIDTAISHVEGREVFSGLNGHPLMLRGAVWQSPSWQMRSQGQLEGMLDAARGLRLNCLKVLHLENEAFYEACDRRGLLVWQVLPFSPEEARMFITQLGHHACIVMWSLPPLYVDENRPAPLLHPQVKPVAELLAELGDDRPFLGVSPGGPVGRATLDDLGRDRCFDVEGPDVYRGAEWLGRYFALDDALLRTMSPPALLPLPRLRKLAGDFAPWPPQGVLWAHRGGDAPQLDPGDARDWLGQDITGDVTQMVRLSRYQQALMMRYGAQRARARQAAGFFAGQLGERFPVLSSPALIEFSGAKRPAYFALASAFAPIALCARLDRFAYWVDTHLDLLVEMLVDPQAQEDGPVTLSAACYTHNGQRIFQRRWEVPLTSQRMPLERLRLPDFPGMVLIRLELDRGNRTLAREDIPLCVGLRAPEAPLIAPPLTLLTIEDECLLNAGESIAFGLTCDGYEEEWMPGWGALLPGEFHPIGQNAHIEGHNMQLLFGAAPLGMEEDP